MTEAERAEHTLQALVSLFRVTPIGGRGQLDEDREVAQEQHERGERSDG